MKLGHGDRVSISVSASSVRGSIDDIEEDENLSGMPTSVEMQPLLDIFLQKTPGMGYPLGHDMFQIRS
jgi:hypothetical protein